MAASIPPRRSLLLRAWDAVVLGALEGLAAVLRALPPRFVLSLADLLGTLLYVLDRRGRRVGRENLDVAFGDGRTPVEKRRILRASFRQILRSMALLLHVSPLTRERYLRWVDVPREVEERFRASVRVSHGGVLVSGHLGNWELLLGLKSVHGDLPDLVFLAETLTSPGLNRFLERVRGSGGGTTAMRRGGARSVVSHVRRGGAAALLVDRNVRRVEGGIWAPFLGLEARTTPLPGWIAARCGVHVLPVLCLPTGDGRYRIWVGPNLAEGVPAGDASEAAREIATRINRVLEQVIRAEPELWNWTLKRFKSRPTRDLGSYPPYSLWDPD